MKNIYLRETRHALLKSLVLTLPMIVALGCSSATTGHAPGVAGGQTLTPGVTNYPLAYIKQPLSTTDIDVRDLITSVTGGDLYVRDQASAGGNESNVTGSITGGMGAVRDLDVSKDGTQIVFSLRLPLDPKLKNTDPKQPNWHIYQYNASTKTVTQLTNDDVTAGHDVGAHYLPDGRIVFSSTRQVATQSILLDEGRPQYQAQTDDRQQSIFLLHVMNEDGTQMHQITFNTNHDFAPSVLSSGQIVFSRWEVTNGADQISLYVANPDGTGAQLYYGANSHKTGVNLAGTDNNVIQFLSPRQRSDGKLVSIVRPFLGTELGGDIVQIDAANFVEIGQPATPGATGGVAVGGPGQVSATTLGVTTDANMPSYGGRFASVYPLYDGTSRMLVSWSPCLVTSGTTTQVCTSSNTTGANVTLAPPQYTLWVYDYGAGTLSPLLGADAGMLILEPIVLQARLPVPVPLTDFFPSTPAGQDMVTAEVGLLDISSVYDFDGLDTAVPNIAGVADPTQPSFYTRPARFIRIQKAVEIPSKTVRKLDNMIFGNAGMGMREILGYAPIQPDGSVQLQVPANVPFTIDVVDANARRISARHTSWLQLLPGETKSCNGCHAPSGTASHGRSGLTTAVNAGAPATGSPFPNTNAALFANAGESMAQTLARISCASGSTLPCSQRLSTDVIYANVWTTGVTLPAGDTDTAFSYTYSGTGGLSEPPPINGNCVPWTAQCRITIHYASAQSATMPFLQSVWNFATRTTSATSTTSAVCVSCHNPVNAAAAAVQVPSGQLDLTTDASVADVNIVNSYEDLLFPHDEQAIIMGTLQNVTVPEPGPPDPVTGLPTTVMVPVSLAAPMSFGSAAASTPFLRMFDGTYHDTVLDHTGYLTPAELRLISEWLDIGAQYYNDPFVAPAAN